MRHRNTGRRLDMNSSQRDALFRNMATSLFLHGSIRTTTPRARELRRYAERLLSIGKRAPSVADLATLSGAELAQAQADRVAAIRRLTSVLQDSAAVEKVMGEYAERFRTRPGGYTRVVKLARKRPGDNADMAIVQLVEAYDSPVSASREASDAAPAASAPTEQAPASE
jgi:large subunit ribosomal protein L17